MEPEKAYGWLGTLPAGAARDEGISLMIHREARHDAASLLPWVDQISQPEMKRDMSAFLQSWLENPSSTHGETDAVILTNDQSSGFVKHFTA